MADNVLKENFNKKTSSVLGVIFLALLLLAVFAGLRLLKTQKQVRVGAAPASTLFISPPTQTTTPGSEFDLSVKIDTGENKITGADIIMNFDTDAFEILSLTKGANISTFENTISESFDNSTGQLVYTNFTLDKNKAVSGSAIELLNVRVKAKSNAILASYSFEIDPTSAASAVSESTNVVSKRENGEVKIEAATGGIVGEPNSCGGTCGSNYNCKGDLFCYQGYCRNPQCANSFNCKCSSATTKPTTAPLKTNKPVGGAVSATRRPGATPTATLLPTDAPEIILDNENGNNPFLATTPPLDRENENQNQEPENKFIKLFYGLVYVLGGSVILVLLVNAYKYLTGKYKKPTVINPE